MSAERILSLIKKCDSKNPMSLRVLSEKMGMEIGELHPVIQEMYDTRGINRCVVTKDGVTDLMLWPTGVPERLSFKSFSINPKREIEFTVGQIVAEAMALTKKNQEKPAVENGKSKARIMIEMIAEKGTATGKELLEASGASVVKPFIKSYYDRGLIEIAGEYNEKTYSLAAGVTPEQLLTDGRGKSVKQKPIPRRPEPQHVVHSVAPPDQIADVAETAEEERLVCQKTMGLAPRHARFRLARASDGTLMLFGLGSEPIELDEDQTNLLVKFVTAGTASHG